MTTNASTTTKRRTAFQLAKRGATYASIGWSVDEVRALRPAWDEARATAFLADVEERLAAETLRAGWAALATLLKEHEDSNGGDR